MNARLYDPIIGRFMSADSIVPDLYTPLDHNRYSYVRGNPVSSRDPTGHNPLLVAAAVFFAWSHYGDNPTLQMASTVLLSVAMMNPSTTPFAAGASKVGNAMVHSGLTSLTISFLKSGKIDRKSLENAGIASASAGLTNKIAHGWIGSEVGTPAVQYEWAKVTAVHMLTQGAISDLRGDKFIHGAIAGLAAKSGGPLTDGLGRYEGAVITATLSGVAAEATGGDFAQGAMTGAIIHLYNDMAGGKNPLRGMRIKGYKNGDIRLTHEGGSLHISTLNKVKFFGVAGLQEILPDLFSLSAELDETVYITELHRPGSSGQHSVLAADLWVKSYAKGGNTEWLRDIAYNTGLFNRVASYSESNIIHVDYLTTGYQGKYHAYAGKTWIRETYWK
jgi:hypothetical protein